MCDLIIAWLSRLRYAKNLLAAPALTFEGDVTALDWTIPPRQPRPQLLYASANNPGAIDVARRIVAAALPDNLHVPQDAELAALAAELAMFSGMVGRACLSSSFDQEGRPPAKRHRRLTQNLSKEARSVLPECSKAFGHGTRRSSLPMLRTELTRVVTRKSKAGKAHEVMGAPFFMTQPSFFLLYLNDQTFMGTRGEELAAELRYMLIESRRTHGDSKMKIVLVHERDPAAGGCDFDRFIACTPADLVHSGGLYKPLATSLYGGTHTSVSLAEVLKSMGLVSLKKMRKIPTKGPSVRVLTPSDRLSSPTGKSAKPTSPARAQSSRLSGGTNERAAYSV